jgi:hypothetical protein
MEPNFNRDLPRGREYEAFIYAQPCYAHITANLHQGSDTQENDAMMEIKYDSNICSGHLYIEIADRMGGVGGIYRPTIKTLLIGNYRNSWVFDIQTLREADHAQTSVYDFSGNLDHYSDKYKHVAIATSKGYLLPVEDADKMCLTKHNWRDIHE